jgi:hypothetical protein
MAVYAAALLEELESLVEQLDQQEASKKQALDRAEAAERDLEALKLEQSSVVSNTFLLYLYLPTVLSHIDALLCGYPPVHTP